MNKSHESYQRKERSLNMRRITGDSRVILKEKSHENPSKNCCIWLKLVRNFEFYQLRL